MHACRSTLEDPTHEFTYGHDRAAADLAVDRDDVVAFAAAERRPLVDTTAAGPDALLNANSYQKGAWVLHMLRRRLGDGPFFTGLRAYYARYRDGNASTDDFRRVMEEFLPRPACDPRLWEACQAEPVPSLDAFFEQWTRSASIPLVEASWRYDAAAREVVLDVRQVQENTPMVFPLDVGLTFEGAAVPVPVARTVEVDDRAHTFRLPADFPPVRVTLDPGVWLLADLRLSGPE